MPFFGRNNELAKLNNEFNRQRASLAVIYGRRRVGKSELIKYFCKNKKHFYFEGLEPQKSKKNIKKIQISHFLIQLSRQTGNPLYTNLDFKEWNHKRQNENGCQLPFSPFSPFY